jgi:hypothetical protein
MNNFNQNDNVAPQPENQTNEQFKPQNPQQQFNQGMNMPPPPPQAPNYSYQYYQPQQPQQQPYARAMNIEQPVKLPEKYKPLGAWAYFGYSLLFCLPIIGLILLIVFSFSDKNINRRNFARSYWVAILIVFIVSIVLSIIFGPAFIKYMKDLQNIPSW